MRYIHRYARFAADGTGLHFGALCWDGSAGKPVPPHDAAFPDSYVVPLDDRPDDWHRLEAEAHVHGHCRHARHADGRQHPAHAHIRVGGTLTWEAAPHPDVAAHQQETRGMSDADLIAYLAGPS